MNEVFVSYCRRDGDAAHEIVDALLARNYDPWFDWGKIKPGAPWRDACLNGAQVCDSLLFLISPDSVRSSACAMELNCAIRHNKRIIPMMVKPVSARQMHPSLSALNWLRYDQDKEKAIAQLFELLSSPRYSLLHLSGRPSAYLKIHYLTGKKYELGLLRDCYWIGRHPDPDEAVAGMVNLPDKNPRYPAISKLHLILSAVNDRWLVINLSKNGYLLKPRKKVVECLLPEGKPMHPPLPFLADGDELHIFGNRLFYREIQPLTIEPTKEECPTFPGFEQ